MNSVKSILILLVLAFSSLGLAVDPPTEAELKARGVTFRELVEVEQERHNLFPEYLRREHLSLPAKAASAASQAKEFWARALLRATVGMRSDDPSFKIMKALFDRVFKESQPGIWEKITGRNAKAQPMTRAQYEQLIGLLAAMEKSLGELDNFVKDVEENRILPDFDGFRDYGNHDAAVRLHRFFEIWIANLEQAITYSESIIYNFNLVKQRFNEINGASNPTIDECIGRMADSHAKLVDYLAKAQAYGKFERKCDALRTFISGRDVAEAVILDQIATHKVPFKYWVHDFETFGPGFLAADPRASVSVPFIRWALDRFNGLTISNLANLELVAQVDGAYRIFIIRLQIDDARAEDFPYLVQQRQLARNGMKHVLEAYLALKRSICSSSVECARPTFASLFALLSRVKSWTVENPLEAKIVVEELNHAYSILAGSSDSMIGQVADAFENILRRRSAGDFLRELLYGDYQPLHDPKAPMPPEIIALTNLAPALPYMVAVAKGLAGGGLLANMSTFALSFAGGPPATVMACASAIIGAVSGAAQVKIEKQVAKRIPNSAQANAVMASILAWGKTGDLKGALKKGATLFLARKGAQWFGNRCMEGGWKEAACDATIAALGPVYAWFTGDIATGAAMVGGYACVRWAASAREQAENSSCSRANAMIATIAQNLSVSPEELEREARKSSADPKTADADYKAMIAGVSKGEDAEQTQAIFDALFSGKAFGYPNGIKLLEMMARAPR